MAAADPNVQQCEPEELNTDEKKIAAAPNEASLQDLTQPSGSKYVPLTKLGGSKSDVEDGSNIQDLTQPGGSKYGPLTIRDGAKSDVEDGSNIQDLTQPGGSKYVPLTIRDGAKSDVEDGSNMHDSASVDNPNSHPNATILQDPTKPGGSKCVPPNMLDGATKSSDNPNNPQNREDMTAIRITNLSKFTTDVDIKDLVKPFGPICRIFLEKDDITDECIGFSYIHFKFQKDAADAIYTLNGYRYDHLILSVDWVMKTQEDNCNSNISAISNEKILQIPIKPSCRKYIPPKLRDTGTVKCRIYNGDHCTTNCPDKDIQYLEEDEKLLCVDENEEIFDKKNLVVAPNAISLVKCHICDGDHWTERCPNKDYLLPATIKISNLFDVTYRIIKARFATFRINKIRLKTDYKHRSLGVAYIHFKFKKDAVAAINELHGGIFGNFVKTRFCVPYSNSEFDESEDEHNNNFY